MAMLVCAVTACRKDSDDGNVTFEHEQITIDWTSQGARHYTYIVDGNGEYSWAVEPEGIVDVKEVMYGTVTLIVNTPGTAVLTLTDRLGTSDSLTINVVVPE